MKNPAVADVVTIAGYDLLSGAQRTNAGISFVTLKDWSERRDPKLDARNLAPAFAALNADFRDGVVIGFNPPPIPGLSTTGGFEFYLQDRSGGTLQSLANAAQRVVQAANKRPELSGVQTTFTTDEPQYRLDVDRDKAKALGVPINTIFDAMQSTFGSLYVNDFILFGRTYRVTMSSEGAFRQSAEDMRHVFVRSKNEHHGSPRCAGNGSSHYRARRRGSLQRLPGCKNSRQSGSRRVLRTGHCGDTASRVGDAFSRTTALAGRVRPIRKFKPRGPGRQASCLDSSPCS